MVKIEMEYGEAPCINCKVIDKISGSAPSYNPKRYFMKTQIFLGANLDASVKNGERSIGKPAVTLYLHGRPVGMQWEGKQLPLEINHGHVLPTRVEKAYICGCHRSRSPWMFPNFATKR